jgi:hypothetical protein
VTLKTKEPPIGLDVAEAETLLLAVASETELSTRLERLSGLLLGRAYVEGSLGGGPDRRKNWGLLNAFDCVTLWR